MMNVWSCLRCERYTVRIYVTMLLTVLVLACPFICGAAESEHGSHGRNGDAGGNAPAHCPEDEDSCFCRGAVRASDVRATAPDHDAPAPPFPIAAPVLAAHPLHHLTWEGSPTGLAGWGGSLTIRALLQNFRC